MSNVYQNKYKTKRKVLHHNLTIKNTSMNKKKVFFKTILLYFFVLLNTLK